MPKNKLSLISIHQMVVKVSFLSEKSAHQGRFLVCFSLIATSTCMIKIFRRGPIIFQRLQLPYKGISTAHKLPYDAI